MVLELRTCVGYHVQITHQCPHLGLGYDEACPKKTWLGDVRTEHPFGNNLRPYFECLSTLCGVGDTKAPVKGIQPALDPVREAHEPFASQPELEFHGLSRPLVGDG